MRRCVYIAVAVALIICFSVSMPISSDVRRSVPDFRLPQPALSAPAAAMSPGSSPKPAVPTAAPPYGRRESGGAAPGGPDDAARDNVEVAPAASSTAVVAAALPAVNGGLGPVILDAGHGGTDPGSVAGELTEKDIVLDVVSRTAELLGAAGVGYLLTRPDDSFVSLERRVEIVNDADGAFLVSVHCDWYEDTAINGTSTLYDAVDAPGGGELAKTVQRHMPGGLGTADRGVHPLDDIVILRDAGVPAVIVELAFLSNASDSALLATDAFHERAAQNLAAGIAAALTSVADATVPSTPRVPGTDRRQPEAP